MKIKYIEINKMSKLQEELIVQEYDEDENTTS
jgi:hypothetical protein